MEKKSQFFVLEERMLIHPRMSRFSILPKMINSTTNHPQSRLLEKNYILFEQISGRMSG